MDPYRLDGEIALITGGGTGLGRAISFCMARAGARVVLVSRRETFLREAVEEINAELGERAAYRVHDVAELARAGELIESISRDVGVPSILVNNAGVHLKKAMLETTEEEFLAVMNTHVMGAYALTRALAPRLIERGAGSVIFTSSMAAMMGIPLVVAYSAAKSAYAGIVRALAAELSPHGVRVNAVAPGWIESPMLRQALAGDPARAEKILSRTPMATFGKPEDIGWAAVYLASPAARFITGIQLPVDGGASMGF